MMRLLKNDLKLQNFFLIGKGWDLYCEQARFQIGNLFLCRKLCRFRNTYIVYG